VNLRRRAAIAGGALIAALLVAGCSNGTSVRSPFSTRPPALLHGPEYEVTTGPVNGLGTVLVDGRGITLYMFANDVRGRPSRCYDICALQWPALVLPAGVSRPVAGSGVKASLVGTSARTDGSTQITYNGWPLYVWLPDKGPGQATGQALTNAGGLWYVLSPVGSPIVTPSP
jgi:predicted lipoprotein with Yx(FWY)xxD motif